MALCKHLGLFVSHLPRALLVAENATQSSTTTAPSPLSAPPSSKPSLAPFRPGIAVIVGVLTTMFSLTFLLLLYAKHCKRGGEGGGYRGGGRLGMTMPSWEDRRNSGVERAVVESLPVFRFGSLLGQKEGLECAVCLSRFEPAEALRLLPKCRHAFHVECVDVWLDAHSTCPLCRLRVDPEDVLLLPHDPRTDRQPEVGPNPEPKASPEKPRVSKTRGPFTHKVSGRHSSAGEKSTRALQIVVHRADSAELPPRRSRRSVDSLSIRSTEPGKRRDGLLLSEEERERFAHRIVVSNSEPARERWSDLQPSDILFLRSEMIITGSGRFSATHAPRASSSSAGGRGVINSRCVSEITGVSRFPPSANIGVQRRAEEQRTMRRWLGFAAKRTARWLGSRGPSESSAI